MLERWGNVLLRQALRVAKGKQDLLVDLDAELLSALARTCWADPLPAILWVVDCRRHVPVGSSGLLLLDPPPTLPLLMPGGYLKILGVAEWLLDPDANCSASLGAVDDIVPVLCPSGIGAELPGC